MRKKEEGQKYTPEEIGENEGKQEGEEKWKTKDEWKKEAYKKNKIAEEEGKMI